MNSLIEPFTIPPVGPCALYWQGVIDTLEATGDRRAEIIERIIFNTSITMEKLNRIENILKGI